MNHKEATTKYRKKVVKSYSDADKYCWINTDDKDLQPIKIPLPEPPDWSVIDGFLLQPEDQIFTIQEYPKRLKQLEYRIRGEIKKDNTIKSISKQKKEFPLQMWEFLNKNQDAYKDEIEWIEKQWYHRIYGYWFFCNGKPTYLNGWNWHYLNYNPLEGRSINKGLPDYRERDRKWYHAQKYFYEDTTTPVMVEVKKDGKKVIEPHIMGDGSCKLQDAGGRTVLGTINLKPRRVGDTSKAQEMNLELSTRSLEFHGGVQGDTDQTGGGVFSHQYIFPYRKQPWFYLPESESSMNPKKEVSFNNIAGEGLGSWVDYATTAHRSFYDGTKLKFYHSDEPGKVKMEDVAQRHQVVRRCLMEGSVFIGFAIYTSTVDEMSGSAGQNFFDLCQDSHYEQRDINGRTKSGLVNIFFPGYEGLAGYVGKFGESIIEDPTEEQIPYVIEKTRVGGRVIGAKEFLENEREKYRRSGEFDKLSEEKRMNPMTYRECFTPPAKNTFWNVAILEQREQELKFEFDPTRRGNFEWSDGFGSPVVFIDNREGRFVVSKFLQMEANQFKRVGGIYYPVNSDKFVASADAFRFEQTQGTKQSDGGGAVKWLRDLEVDSDEKNIEFWESDDIICTYKFRPSGRKAYAEDMLKMCIYYGAMMYPENNVTVVQDNFIDWGYRGYLLYDIDPNSGKRNANSGFNSLQRSKEKLFTLTAVGGTHLASESRMKDIIAKKMRQKVDLMFLNIPGVNMDSWKQLR